MNIDFIISEIEREPCVKTCKNLLKNNAIFTTPIDDFQQAMNLLDSGDEYVRIFVVMYISKAYDSLDLQKEMIHKQLILLSNDWSKKFIRYGLIPSVEAILTKADSELSTYLTNKLKDPDYPVLPRIYFEAYSRVIMKKNNYKEVTVFLDLIGDYLISNNLDTQQGLVSAINNIGKKNITLLQKYILDWIEIKNINTYYVIRKVFDLKFGELAGTEFRQTCKEKMNSYEEERIRLISEKFSSDESKVDVTYQEIIVSTMLHFINSPMLPFNWGANPYRGCLHACEYCYGRTSHEFLGHTKDEFERIIYVKINADKALEKQIMTPKWTSSRNKLINLGTVTDPYQQIEEL